MRISEAAKLIGLSPRMLRYREDLGLLPPVRLPRVAAGGTTRTQGSRATTHRRFEPADLDAVRLGMAIERRYDVSPAALSFAVRVLADPRAQADVAELGRRLGRIRPLPALALDFEKERAQRLLGQSARRG